MSKKILVAFIGSLALGACERPNSESPERLSPAQDASPTESFSPTQPPALEAISSEIAHLYAGLVVAIDLHPDRNAVDAYANGMKWRKVPEEMNVMLNAQRGYAGTLANQVVLLGSDGSNDIFSIAVRDNFDPQVFKDRLKGFISLAAGVSETSMGQKMEMYRLLDGDRQVGILSVTYGTDAAIQGSGTVGYISEARARKEGIGY